MNNENHGFLNKENIEMIWEIIMDESLIKKMREHEIKKLQQNFISNTKQFYQREKQTNQNLMKMNKKFIEKMLNQIKMMDKINDKSNDKSNIKNNENKGITIEDFQNFRKTEFENQLLQKQNDFQNAMTIKLPEKPKFNETLDGPINEMEDLIARTLAQRNFDIEQIQQTVDNEKVKSFLKSQETSIKAEKELNPLYNVNQNEVKYIKIGSEELPQISEAIDIQSSLSINKNENENEHKYDKRHISWADENIDLVINEKTQENENEDEDEEEAQENDEDIDIFSKLKLKFNANTFDNIEEQPFDNDEIVKMHNKISDLDNKISDLDNKISDLDNKINEILSILKNK